MRKVDGKVAFITGASKGIGRAIALAFADEGAMVAGTYLPSEAAPDALTDELVRRTGAGTLLPADAANESDVRESVARAVSLIGPIDILVANAGYAELSSVAEMSVGAFDRMIAVHLRGTFLSVHEVLPSMIARGSGTIITISSQLAYIGAENLAHYAAAKAGILGFTRSLAREVIRDGVRVNCIAPGAIATGILSSTPEEDARLADHLPIGRLGRVEDVAPTAVFLASDESAFYVGQVLSPNGGEVML
ncbi:MAG: SDR family NAD(P)-dependent oxidoreductase [Thermomicrobiales bacterium]